MMLADFGASEDVAQEAIAAVMEHRESFRAEGDFSSWAYGIAVNLCRAKRKSDRKGPVPVDQRLLEHTEIRNPGHGPATSVMLHETHERAAVAVRALSPLLREVFVLHYIEGLPYSSVAKILQISPGAARLRAKRARESLKDNLAKFLSPEVHRSIQAEASSKPPRKK
jgi:RNA polymerase sigma-70 factor (ECF subfamily)